MSFPSTKEILQFFKENVVGQEEAIERLLSRAPLQTELQT
jgi:hypothetical protein